MTATLTARFRLQPTPLAAVRWMCARRRTAPRPAIRSRPLEVCSRCSSSAPARRRPRAGAIRRWAAVVPIGPLVLSCGHVLRRVATNLMGRIVRRVRLWGMRACVQASIVRQRSGRCGSCASSRRAEHEAVQHAPRRGPRLVLDDCRRSRRRSNDLPIVPIRPMRKAMDVHHGSGGYAREDFKPIGNVH